MEWVCASIMYLFYASKMGLYFINFLASYVYKLVLNFITGILKVLGTKYVCVLQW